MLDDVIFNNKRPPEKILARYRREKAEFVDVKGLDRARRKPRYVFADLIDKGRFVRHGPRRKLAKILLDLI